MKPSLLSLAVLLHALPGLSSPALAQCQEGILLSAAGPANAGLGEAVDVAGDFAFAGAMLDPTHGTHAGSVTVFEYGPAGFVEGQTLFPPTPIAFDHFGQALAADGQWLVVGTRNEAAGLSPGAGVVYRLEGQDWRWFQTLSVSGPDAVSYLGDAVALEGDRIALGAPGDSTQVGAVYVFDLRGGAWVQAAVVEPRGPHTVRGFGCDVALSGDRMIVGADFSSPGGLAPGAAYVFELQHGAWVQTARLVASDATWSDVYGQRVDLDGETAVVSGWGHDVPGGGRGAVWSFELQAGSWIESQKIVSTPANGSRFGFSVDLEGERLLVGARSDGGWFFPQSFAELFHRGPQGFESERVETGPPSAKGIGFGTSVRLWGDSMLVGNPTGSALQDYAGEVRFADLPRVEASPYCAATPNSTGRSAGIELACPGILEERLLLRAAPVPDGCAGLFLAGTTQAYTPLHDGFLCVGGTLVRLKPVLASGGVLADELDLVAAQAAGGPLTPGSTWHFQAWFRDPAAGGTGANLSSGLTVTLAH
jgi:hypothetical protein